MSSGRLDAMSKWNEATWGGEGSQTTAVVPLRHQASNRRNS